MKWQQAFVEPQEYRKKAVIVEPEKDPEGVERDEHGRIKAIRTDTVIIELDLMPILTREQFQEQYPDIQLHGKRGRKKGTTFPEGYTPRRTRKITYYDREMKEQIRLGIKPDDLYHMLNPYRARYLPTIREVRQRYKELCEIIAQELNEQFGDTKTAPMQLAPPRWRKRTKHVDIFDDEPLDTLYEDIDEENDNEDEEEYL